MRPLRVEGVVPFEGDKAGLRHCEMGELADSLEILRLNSDGTDLQ